MKQFTTSPAVHSFTKIAGTILVGLALIQMQTVRAGWSANVNGAGSGWSYVNVRSVDGFSNSKSSSGTYPSSAIPSGLPKDSSGSTYANASGYAGGIVRGSAYGSGGDGADNLLLQQRVVIRAADCPKLDVDAYLSPGAYPYDGYLDAMGNVVPTNIDFDPNSGSGTITVNAIGTAGTGMWTQGFEYFPRDVTGDNTVDYPPIDNPNTPENETVEFLKHWGEQIWDFLIVGPFAGGVIGDNDSGKCAYIIPYTLQSKDHKNLYVQTDGVAKSTSLSIQCPGQLTVKCTDSVPHPTYDIEGCGANLTVTFNPAAPDGGTTYPAGFFPIGRWPVTVTVQDRGEAVKDEMGNIIGYEPGPSASCTFDVVVEDNEAPVITATGTPANGVLGFNPTIAEIEAALGTATATDNCGPLTPTALAGEVIVDGCQRFQTRTWTVSDAAGNPATPVSRTATWTVDTAAPVITATGAPANGVLGFNPTPAQIEAALGTATAADSCGSVTPIPLTGELIENGCQRSQTRTWTATDAAGNPATPVSRTATWTVDTAAPVITATGTPANGVLGFNPTTLQIQAALGTATATDNCGSVTPIPLTGELIENGCQRSQTRTWTATDAAGNPAIPVSRKVTWTVDLTPPTVSLKPFAIECGNDRSYAKTVTTVTVPVPTHGSGNVITDNCGGPVTVSPNQPQAYNGTGAGVTWTFTDAAGNATTVLQKLTVTGLGFDGFDEPIEGTGGSCGSPKLTKKVGSNIPVKFETECKGCGVIIPPGQPTLSIEKSNSQCTSLSAVGGGDFTLVGNEYHFNWNTTGLPKASYKLTATLQDGSKKFVWIKLN